MRTSRLRVRMVVAETEGLVRAMLEIASSLKVYETSAGEGMVWRTRRTVAEEAGPLPSLTCNRQTRPWQRRQ
jgi:hypothetical protein